MTITASAAADGAAVARARFRAGESETTAGLAPGHVQANLIAVPADWAQDLSLFCAYNRQACPVLDITEAGSPATRLAAGADLRTDLPRYRVWRDGGLVAEPAEVTAHWRDDLVAFLLGCSFTFETRLAAAGIPLRHVEQGRNVPMYVTNRPCRPAGRLSGPLVVSMRPVPRDLVPAARAATRGMATAHGCPLHTGDPAALGIRALSCPDFGDAVRPAPGDVPVFWACGVTTQTALMASRPPFAVTHAPGHMLITDLRDGTHPGP
ncbi:putative hydro-lyase [Streptomyces boncukensis]|uniref:Putative hydro-lyase G5C65_19500 n=1 Tax=Streptomyces boncukensis TaxID=2711219 RepID=A0A6G4WYX7_9ACTN|nr:putative hydro-lyase [Streptomyces boncukensis]NGO70499.1 putative hydro-lyase [Streptomyces boncukensis]